MSRSVKVTQMILAMIALALVGALFLGGMVGGRSRDTPASPTRPGPVTPSPVPSGQRMPGVPATPVAEQPTVSPVEDPNPDRQLDYRAQGEPSVDFLDGLGSYQEYATQTVEWEECAQGGRVQCTTVLAPLDWEDPAGDAIELAVTRVPGGDSSRGPLFVNPGGPGFGGQEMAVGLAGRWENYDTYGWDPRGTGESTHVVCGTFEETEQMILLDGSPDDTAEDRALRQGSRDFAQQCRDGSGKLLDHLTTIDVVRDLDLLRHLAGAEKLNYVGVSYGTYVGAMYAQLFPDTAGRLVLDAAVEITDREPTPQVAGFELALDNFIEWCAGSDLCDLGDDAAAIRADIDSMLTRLDQRPLEVNGRRLTQTLGALGIAVLLYEDDEAYRSLAQYIGEAIAGDGEALLTLADLYNGRTANSYGTPLYAFPAMGCVDGQDEGADAVLPAWRETFSVAPLMAPNMGTSYACEFWTADSAPQLDITAPGAPPILVVGTTGDSATPYEQAVSMAEQLESGSLLTLEGAGHGAVTGDNQCIAEAVDGFLYDGVVPAEGTRCT
ncbi:alpha/beta hydrolase [Tessaracoccus lubricantis]|uniref:Alpha/beta hydrolase n=1 Tax=Tessaracoccus lubricantis TaxID=545543 RepID=A0ABP9F2Q9_9ACTN